MKKKVLIILAIYLLGFLTPIVYKKVTTNVLESKVIYTIRIDREFINLRPEVNLNSDVIRQVYKDETFKVIDYYEGNVYNWYKVIYDDNKVGFIASGKEESWVVVINEK